MNFNAHNMTIFCEKLKKKKLNVTISKSGEKSKWPNGVPGNKICQHFGNKLKGFPIKK